MPKLVAPLFSFQAHGSLAKSVYFSRSRDTNLARRIPVPTDARTLPQLYQRWRFTDARYYWRTLSDAQRAAWNTDAHPHQLTGWAWFLSSYLPNPPDQVLWLRLDTTSDVLAPDSSGKANHAGISRAVRVPAIIDAGRDFAAFFAALVAESSASLHTPNAFTLMTWLSLSSGFAAAPTIIWLFYRLVGYRGYEIQNVPPNGTIHLRTGDGTIADASLGDLWTDLGWHHLAVTYDAVQAASFIDGVPHATSPDVRPSIGDPDVQLIFANVWGTDYTFGLDDVRMYNRALSPEHIREIATTQVYPSPPA